MRLGDAVDEAVSCAVRGGLSGGVIILPGLSSNPPLRSPCPKSRAVVERRQVAGGGLDGVAARHDVCVVRKSAHGEAALIITRIITTEI